VEETAFIPNLFTPNEDGKNDALKIYGLGPVSNFSFAIYNREGTLVYDTRNISEITTQGWNGTTRGMNLPAGVYHWKVAGEINGGKRLQLNGKNSGSVVLLR
jgi:gliding motility-associated-like protein